jgi:hypothetical protein
MIMCNSKPRTYCTLLESIVMNEYYAETGGLRRCRAAANSTYCIYPGNRQFLPTPCFVHRVHAKVPVFRDGNQVRSVQYTVVQTLWHN